MTVTELIENLESACIACGDEGFSVEEVAIDHAIEAIRVLSFIAENEGCDSYVHAQLWVKFLNQSEAK